MCAANVPERASAAITSLKEVNIGMKNFISNPPSNILMIRLANMVVVLTQSLHVLSPRGKHSENCYLSSPTVQSEQNLEGMSATCIEEKCFCMVARPGQVNLWCALERSHSNDRSPIATWSQFYRLDAALEPTEVPWTLIMYGDDVCSKKAAIHYVDGRQPRG